MEVTISDLFSGQGSGDRDDQREGADCNLRGRRRHTRINLLQTQRVGELERTTCLLRAKQKYADKIRSRSTPTRYEAEVFGLKEGRAEHETRSVESMKLHQRSNVSQSQTTEATLEEQREGANCNLR